MFIPSAKKKIINISTLSQRLHQSNVESNYRSGDDRKSRDQIIKSNAEQGWGPEPTTLYGALDWSRDLRSSCDRQVDPTFDE